MRFGWLDGGWNYVRKHSRRRIIIIDKDRRMGAYVKYLAHSNKVIYYTCEIIHLKVSSESMKLNQSMFIL